MELRWTKKAPTVPGWYWIDCGDPDECEFNCPHMESVHIVNGVPTTYNDYGEPDTPGAPDSFFTSPRWAGPIPAPTEAEEA